MIEQIVNEYFKKVIKNNSKAMTENDPTAC